ncbi:MAG: response regulator, partial [Alkalimonas sp.]|nr:response regulator [Alkalimonas sp.]
LLAYAAENSAPDVLLIDYQLGQHSNGLDLYQQLQVYWQGVPGILVSASPQADLARQAQRLGLLFLAKPIKPAALRASLNQINLLKRQAAE